MELLRAVLCLLATAAVVFGDVTNLEVKRLISIQTHIEEVAFSIEFQSKGGSTDHYILPFPEAKASHLSYITALTRQGTALQIEAVDAAKVVRAPNFPTKFFKIILPKTVKDGETFFLQAVAVFTHTLRATPDEISQDDDQLVVYDGDHYALSAYPSQRQVTQFKLASDKIESHTEKYPFKIGSRSIEYGPYTDLPAFATSRLQIHSENNSPFITFREFRKDVEISHWGNVAIEEHYAIQHTGARLKGSFSRFDYQRGRGQSGKASFRTLAAALPPHASDVYYRDQIGNISSSHFRPSNRNNQPSLLQLDPRFPMFGGWKTDFYIGYNLPISSALSVSTSDSSRFVLNISFSTPFMNAVVDQCTVRVILPEGATNIQYASPFPVTASHDVHFTYLDTVGRPVLVLRKGNLVNHHNQPIIVVYNFHNTSIFYEPIYLIIGFFAFFVSAMVYMRIDLSLAKKKSA